MKRYFLSISLTLFIAAGCSNQSALTESTPSQTKATTTTVTKSVSINKLSPPSGQINIQVTISGQNFTKTDNLIIFGDSTGKYHLDGTADNVIATVGSTNGTELTFTVPSSGPSGALCDSAKHCIGITAMTRQAGNYKVSVKNINGTSNSSVFSLIK